MTVYFKDRMSGFVIRFDNPHDIEQMRKQTADYTESTEEEYNACRGIVPKETKTLTLSKK